MPRPPRADVAGEIHHALNRGNVPQAIFHNDEDHVAFERVFGEASGRFDRV
nr:hypothetical protein [Rhodopirellula sp. SM50]